MGPAASIPGKQPDRAGKPTESDQDQIKKLNSGTQRGKNRGTVDTLETNKLDMPQIRPGRENDPNQATIYVSIKKGPIYSDNTHKPSQVQRIKLLSN